MYGHPDSSAASVRATRADAARAIVQRLDDVSDLVPGQRLPDWRPNRRNAHYETVLWFASMVLKHRSVDLPEGAVEVNGFIIDMAKVFEDVVTAALTESLERIDGRVSAQDPQTFDLGGTVEMNPVLVWYRDGEARAVIDAKYKAERVAGDPNADLYQMLAYCTALGLRVGHLVYARGNEAEQQMVLRGGGVELHAHALDLELMPADLLMQVDGVASRVLAATTLSAIRPLAV